MRIREESRMNFRFCFNNWLDGSTIYWDVEDCRRYFFFLEEEWCIKGSTLDMINLRCLCHIQVEIPIDHRKYVPGTGEEWTGDINLWILSVQMPCKAVVLKRWIRKKMQIERTRGLSSLPLDTATFRRAEASNRGWKGIADEERGKLGG